MDTVLNIRTNQVVKDKAQEVLLSMGMNTSTAVNIFLRQVVAEGRLPFTPTSSSTAKSHKLSKKAQ